MNAFLAFFPRPWPWEVGLLMVALLIFSLAGVLTSIRSRPDAPKILLIERIPLSADVLTHWIDSALLLLMKQDQGRIRILARSLPEFIEWGRRNHEALAKAIEKDDSSTFLGVASAIEYARRNQRKIVEHDMRMEEILNLISSKESVADGIRFPEAPILSFQEQTGLDLYKDHEVELTEILYALVPQLPPLIPTWDTAEEDDEESNGRSKIKRSPIAWRTVSASRYGPRVIQEKSIPTKPAQQN